MTDFLVSHKGMPAAQVESMLGQKEERHVGQVEDLVDLASEEQAIAYGISVVPFLVVNQAAARTGSA